MKYFAILLISLTLASGSARAASGGGRTEAGVGWLFLASPTFTPPAGNPIIGMFDFLSFVARLFQSCGIRGAYYSGTSAITVGLFADLTWSTDIDITRTSAADRIYAHWSALSIGPTLKLAPSDQFFIHLDAGITRLAGMITSPTIAKIGFHGEAALGILLGSDQRGLSISVAYLANLAESATAQAMMLRFGGAF